MSDKSESIIYQTDDGLTKIDVRLDEDTVWLTQAEMVELFQVEYKRTHKAYIRRGGAVGDISSSEIPNNCG